MIPVTIVVTACSNLILSIPLLLVDIVTPPVVYSFILQLDGLAYHQIALTD